MRKISLNKVSVNDAKFIYDLKFSKEVRRNSLDKKKIKYDSHLEWLKKKLKDRKSLFYLVCSKNKKKEKLGYIRLDFNLFYYRVTIAILKTKTGQNYGHQTLKKVEKKLKLNSLLFAQVLKSNYMSCKLFKKSGYKLIGAKNKIQMFYKFSKKNERKYLH